MPHFSRFVIIRNPFDLAKQTITLLCECPIYKGIILTINSSYARIIIENQHFSCSNWETMEKLLHDLSLTPFWMWLCLNLVLSSRSLIFEHLISNLKTCLLFLKLLQKTKICEPFLSKALVSKARYIGACIRSTDQKNEKIVGSFRRLFSLLKGMRYGYWIHPF